MFPWLRFWHLVVITLVPLILAVILFGGWGFIIAWLSIGLVALVAFLWDVHGQPMPPATIKRIAEDAGCLALILISGAFGFWLIAGEILETYPEWW